MNLKGRGPALRRRHNIKIDLKQIGYETPDKVQSWAVVNTVMILRLAYNARSLLTNWETVSFSRKTFV
jgi:hypothetical protein